MTLNFMNQPIKFNEAPGVPKLKNKKYKALGTSVIVKDQSLKIRKKKLYKTPNWVSVTTFWVH